MDLQQGFVLTRHWRDTAAGSEVEFWLATDAGPRRLRLAPQPAVAFVPLFKHRHQPHRVVPAHGPADVGNP